MKRTFLTYIFLCFFICGAFSQDRIKELSDSVVTKSSFDTIKFKLDKPYLISIKTGFSNHIERDDAMSPFIYRGTAFPIELCYRYVGTNSRQLFYVNYDKLKLVSKLPNYEDYGLNHYVQNTNLRMGYSYMQRVICLEKISCELYLGCEINSLLNLRQQAYIGNNEFLMLDQFNSLSLTTQIEKRFANNKQIAIINLSMPFVSYVLMRGTYNAYVGDKIDPVMNYSGNMLWYMAKNGNVVSLNKLVLIKADLAFIRFLSNHIGFEFKYSFCYYRFTQYDNLNYSRDLQNSVLLGLIIKL